MPIQCRPDPDRPSELTPESTKKSRNEVLPEKTCSVDWVKSIVIFTERRFKNNLQKKNNSKNKFPEHQSQVENSNDQPHEVTSRLKLNF